MKRLKDSIIQEEKHNPDMNIELICGNIVSIERNWVLDAYSYMDYTICIKNETNFYTLDIYCENNECRKLNEILEYATGIFGINDIATKTHAVTDSPWIIVVKKDGVVYAIGTAEDRYVTIIDGYTIDEIVEDIRLEKKLRKKRSRKIIITEEE